MMGWNRLTPVRYVIPHRGGVKLFVWRVVRVLSRVFACCLCEFASTLGGNNIGFVSSVGRVGAATASFIRRLLAGGLFALCCVVMAILRFR